MCVSKVSIYYIYKDLKDIMHIRNLKNNRSQMDLKMEWDLFVKLLNQRREQGFSLIELVIVVAIMSILLGVGIPFYNRIQERAADVLVRTSMQNSFKECKTKIISGQLVPTFTLDIGLASTNGYYQFYQQYDYVPRDDGFIPPTILGNCIGPLGPHRIGVEKVKGQNTGGELWLNLDTGEKLESGGLSWFHSED